jgi:hypothetical protein
MAKFTTESRRQRITELIERLEAGKDIQARDIALVLTPKQLRAYEGRWAEQQQLRAEPLPSPIARYQRMLHRALMWEGRAEQFGGRTQNAPLKQRQQRKSQQVKLDNKADSLCEDAAEHLREALSEDPSLRMWLDRDVERDSNGHIHIDIQDMPRVITSRSYSNEQRDRGLAVVGKQGKRGCKLDALRAALVELDDADGKGALSKTQQSELAAKLAKLKRS